MFSTTFTVINLKGTHLFLPVVFFFAAYIYIIYVFLVLNSSSFYLNWEKKKENMFKNLVFFPSELFKTKSTHFL